jgi:hypothetical protein
MKRRPCTTSACGYDPLIGPRCECCRGAKSTNIPADPVTSCDGREKRSFVRRAQFPAQQFWAGAKKKRPSAAMFARRTMMARSSGTVCCIMKSVVVLFFAEKWADPFRAKANHIDSFIRAVSSHPQEKAKDNGQNRRLFQCGDT